MPPKPNAQQKNKRKRQRRVLLASRFRQALLKYFGAGRATFDNFSAFGIAQMLDGDGFLPPIGVRAWGYDDGGTTTGRMGALGGNPAG